MRAVKRKTYGKGKTSFRKDSDWLVFTLKYKVDRTIDRYEA